MTSDTLSLDGVLAAVAEMRRAQVSYFKNRTSEALFYAKETESVVDKLVLQWRMVKLDAKDESQQEMVFSKQTTKTNKQK